MCSIPELNLHEKEIIQELAKGGCKSENLNAVTDRMLKIMASCKEHNVYPDFKRYIKDPKSLTPLYREPADFDDKSKLDVVHLFAWEQRFAYICGAARQTYNTNHNFTSKYGDNYDRNVRIHVSGYSGELAVCKYLDVCPVISPILKSAKQGLDAGDCSLLDWNIDVKTTQKTTHATLEVEERKLKNNIDMYVLVSRNYTQGNAISNTFTIQGWITKSDVITDHDDVTEDYRHGNEGKTIYIVDKRNLMPLADILHG